jgi:predicted DNA-binding protein (UPF0251 family)
MPRPLTTRRIGTELRGRVFRPETVSRPDAAPANLTLDGLEALRLADVEGLYQEEAARRMGISRPTFARVLAGARGVVADALVNGKAVDIGGGVVERHPRKRWPCPVHDSGRRRGRGCRCEETRKPVSDAADKGPHFERS